MRAILSLLTVTATFGLATAYLGLSERNFETFEIRSYEDGLDSEPVFQGNEPLAFSEALLYEKNTTIPQLQDRSMDLYKRQNCRAGYGYCACTYLSLSFRTFYQLTTTPALGGCCPSNNRCCPYGYCLEPGNTCCPNGPCQAGTTCCGANNCHPEGTQCCSNGRYCEVGNICVIFRGEAGCCTDLSCTAVVRGGTTSYATTSTPAPPPVVTEPPRTTQVIVDRYTTYYWTVRWWYYSYYWTVFQAQSTVTYTTFYVTTIFTTTATDSQEASRAFEELSKTLTFSTPAEATTLASLVGAAPSPTAVPTTAVETELGTSEAAPVPTSEELSSRLQGDATSLLSRVSISHTSSTRTTSSSSTSSSQTASSSTVPPSLTGGGSSVGPAIVEILFMLFGSVGGILMFWL